MVKRVLLVRHGDEPADDRIVSWCRRNGYHVETRKPFKGDKLGQPGEGLVATVIYGGRFNVYETETHRFLKEEYRWIDFCLEAGVPVLGLCQGAQQIAHHLGAWVGPRTPEIFEFGYYEIEPSKDAAGFLDAPLTVCQAHFHTFDLPQGAVRLAGNANYENQAFRFGDKVYGFQFHPEVTEAGFRRWQLQKADVYGRPGVQERDEQDRLLSKNDATQGAWFEGFLDDFLGGAV